MIRTLIVEDESWVRKGIIGAIDWDGWGMELAGEAENGEEALRLLAERPADLVFIDMKMPRMDGAELLRQLEARGADCEIVVLSGYSDFEYMKQAIASRVFAYLLKPVNAEELADVLHKASLRWRDKRLERLHRQLKLEREALLAELRGGTSPAEQRDGTNRAEQRDGTNFAEQRGGTNFAEQRGGTNRAEPRSGTNFAEQRDGTNAPAPSEDGVRPGETAVSRVAGIRPWSGSWICAMIVRMTERKGGHPFGDPPAGLLEAALPEFRVFVVADGTELLLLCSGNEAPAARALAKQRRLAADLIGDCRTRYGVEARVGIGLWREGGRDVARSGEEAAKALQFERTREGDIVFYDAVREAEMSGLPAIAGDKAVAHLLDNAYAAELTGVVETFFSEMGKVDYVYLPALRTAVVDFMLTLERGLRKNGLEGLLPKLHGEDMLASVEALQSLRELKRWTMEKTVNVAEALAMRQTRPDLIHEIKMYIEHHYDEDIQLIRLAQKYYVNHIYLSRLFKTTTGENFIDYLTRVRMLKAKALLENGQMGMHRVSELVGYQNPYYFTKAYRKFFAGMEEKE